MYYWLFKYLLFRPLIKVVCRPWVEGGENVPETGPAILVSNHISYGDTLVLPAMIDPPMKFPAKAELFHGRTLGGKVVAWFLTVVGQIPMDRSGGRASAQSIDVVADVLADKQILGIYPEGTRSPDGRMYKGKTGVARLVLGHNVPVLPVGTVGTELLRGPFGIPYMKRPGLRIGQTMDFSAYAGQAADRDVLRWVTDEIMAEVQRLSGQDYVDVYATSVKSGSLEGRNIEDKVLPRPGHGKGAPAVAVRAAEAAGDAQDHPESRQIRATGRQSGDQSTGKGHDG